MSTALSMNDSSELTPKERLVVEVMRANSKISRNDLVRHWRIGRLQVRLEWRSGKNLWGRFGGGWNWKVGFQAGGRTVMLSFLVFFVSFSWGD